MIYEEVLIVIEWCKDMLNVEMLLKYNFVILICIIVMVYNWNVFFELKIKWCMIMIKFNGKKV